MALQAWQLAIVRDAETARDQLGDIEYATFIDLAGRWFTNERARLERGQRLRRLRRSEAGTRGRLRLIK
jgi:hypothetical protein